MCQLAGGQWQLGKVHLHLTGRRSNSNASSAGYAPSETLGAKGENELCLALCRLIVREIWKIKEGVLKR